MAFLLGGIVSSWRDSDFKDLHKPAPIENDTIDSNDTNDSIEMSNVGSPLLGTDGTSSVNITSNRHEGSVGNDEEE